MKSLHIKNLYCSVEGKEILKGISLTVKQNEVHALMGPNGSGKSTLAYLLMGHPAYTVPAPTGKNSSFVRIGNDSLLDLEPHERAKCGLFLAFQSPIPLHGVSTIQLLRSSYQSIYKNNAAGKLKLQKQHNPLLSSAQKIGGLSISEFTSNVKKLAKILHIDETLLTRSVHDGFSGGEKKKIEMLQALILNPSFAIFDEIDTGLDVDALRLVGRGIDLLKKNGCGVIIITHYQRILKYIQPDVVHVLVKGKIVATGGSKLVKQIEKEGYSRYEQHSTAN